jgi:multidrug resistance efflux pump
MNENEPKEIARTGKIKKWIEIGIIAAILVALAFAAYWWFVIRTSVYTDKADIEAPLIYLGPQSPAVLKEVLVKEGDIVATNTPVARLGDTYVLTGSSGLIVGTDDSVGALFSPGQAVVTMINPADLRLVARVDENAGLVDVKPGDKVVFTLDAFGGKKFDGVVDTIVPTSYQSSVVFNISDQRAEQQFAVKISYNVALHPEILNGMSAKVWIYK